MGYTREQWEERSSHRTDLSAFLVHLTKGIYDENGGGRFSKFISKFARYIKLENDVNQKGGILWLELSVKQ